MGVQREYLALVNNAPFGIICIKHGRVVRSNPAFAKMFGFEMVPKGLLARQLHLSDADYDAIVEEAKPHLFAGKRYGKDLQVLHQSGERFWCNVIAYLVNPDDRSEGTIWVITDISARIHAAAKLEAAYTDQRLIFDNCVVGIAFVRNRIFVQCNPRFEELFGCGPGELIGKPTRVTYFSDDAHATLGRDCYARMTQGKSFVREVLRRRHDGDPIWLRITGRAIDPTDVMGGSIWNFEDITDRVEVEQLIRLANDELELRVQERTQELQREIRERENVEARLRHLAHHDDLTGLASRSLLEERLSNAISTASGQSSDGVYILFIDLDRFKIINDSLGHHIGDLLLKTVALRLSSALRTTDTVARLGGDEFVIVLPSSCTAAGPMGIANKLLEILRSPFSIKGNDLFVTPSIGVSCFPQDGLTVDALLRNADAAMYHAKSLGRNQACRFAAWMNAAADNCFQVESELRQAITRGEFVLHYQPIFRMDRSTIETYEALIRWQHPQRGLLSPGEFIPIAEDNGLIGQLTERVFELACDQIKACQSVGRTPPKVAINISPLQFRSTDFAEKVCAMVEMHGLPPAFFELEITETAIMQNGDQALFTLNALSDAGFSLSIDDFGTGYSSLAYLKRFPIKTIKIDQSFVTDISESQKDIDIVTAITTLGHKLGLNVVAEGVENEDQMRTLIEVGCDLFQGYLLAGPASADKLRRGHLVAALN